MQYIVKNDVKFLIIEVFRKIKVYNSKNREISNIIELNINRDKCNLPL